MPAVSGIAGFICLLMADFVTGEHQRLQDTEDMILFIFRKHREILDKLVHLFIINHRIYSPDM